MDLEKINEYLDYYYQWSNAKSEPEKFVELDKLLEVVTNEFFSELITNQKFFSWMHLHYYFKDSKEYMSTMAEVGASMVKNAKIKLMHFQNEKQLESYIFKSLKGKANLRLASSNIIIDTLYIKLKKAGERKNNKLTVNETVIKEFDSRIDKVTNDESEGFDNTSDMFDEFISDFDEDGEEVRSGFTSIDNIGDPTEADKQQLNELRTDISLFKDTVAFLLWLINKDLSEEDITLERKISWQIGVNYEELLKEKIGLFSDHILVASDVSTIVRYEHWQNWK